MRQDSGLGILDRWIQQQQQQQQVRLTWLEGVHMARKGNVLMALILENAYLYEVQENTIHSTSRRFVAQPANSIITDADKVELSSRSQRWGTPLDPKMPTSRQNRAPSQKLDPWIPRPDSRTPYALSTSSRIRTALFPLLIFF